MMNDVNGWVSGADSDDGWGNLIFLNPCWLWVTETMEGETADKGGATVIIKSRFNLYGSFSIDLRDNNDPENIRKHL